MAKLISFLRGVNMTGHNSVKMTELSDLYRKLGFTDAETYIQSGNVVFSTNDEFSPAEITVKIEKAIAERFSYNIPVLNRTIEDVKTLFSLNPFLDEDNFDPSKAAVIFLYNKPSAAQIQKVIDVDYPPDKFRIDGREIFIYCPNGFGRTKLYTNFFENKMAVVGTARNWKTITTLLKIAENKK